jgi:hypothetical protein
VHPFDMCFDFTFWIFQVLLISVLYVLTFRVFLLGTFPSKIYSVRV